MPARTRLFRLALTGKAERRKDGLVSSRKPKKHPLLSSTVAVRDEQGRNGYCYIGFSEDFVERVGKALPRGVSTFDPACIHVVYYPHNKTWLVIARYLRSEGEALLWRTTERPHWLRFYEVKNANTQDTKADQTAGEGHRGRAARAATQGG